jgi:hypothetical protein
MRWLFVIFFILAQDVYAQKKWSREAFQVNVRPVLNGILNDFYQMISLFPDFPKEVVTLVESMDTFTSQKEVLRTSCPQTLTKNCLETIETIRKRLSDSQDKVIELRARLKMASSPYLTTVAGVRGINNFQTNLEELKGIFDNASFMIKAGIKSKSETYPLIQQLDELSTFVSLTLVEFIPYSYKENFRHFFFNFIHPIQSNISKPQGYEFFNRNLNQLNFSLNLLNMNLTKRNKKTPEGFSPYLATMHNRWNSLLRY